MVRNGHHDKIIVKKTTLQLTKRRDLRLHLELCQTFNNIVSSSIFWKTEWADTNIHQMNSSQITSYPAIGLKVVNKNVSVSDAWESNTFKLVVNLHCCCRIKMLLVMLSSLSQVRTTRQKVSWNNKTCQKPIPVKFYLPNKLPYVIPK